MNEQKELPLRPISGRILIKTLTEKEENTGNRLLILPDTVKNEYISGKIENMPSNVESELSVGDNVLFGKNSCAEITVNGYKYLVVNEVDIMAKF